MVPLGIKSMPKEQQRRINIMHLQAKLALQSTSLASSIISIDSDDVDALFDELHTCVAWLVHEVGPRRTVILFTFRLLVVTSWMSVGAAPHNILRVWCQEDRLQSKFLDRLLFKHLSSSLDT